MRIALASTTNFVAWEKDGLIDAEFNRIDNKNGMLFEPVQGQPVRMLHRPMEGPDGMMIHWAEAPSLAGPWRDRGVLMRPIPDPEFKDVWTGGGARRWRSATGGFSPSIISASAGRTGPASTISGLP